MARKVIITFKTKPLILNIKERRKPVKKSKRSSVPSALRPFQNIVNAGFGGGSNAKTKRRRN